MYATLVGTDTGDTRHRALFERLCAIAAKRGFVAPDASLPVAPDQTSIRGWSLELRGPADGDAQFLLSVTAPHAPSISPLPVMKTVAGPLFSVMVMDSYLLVWRQDHRDVSEFKEPAAVERSFASFLDGLRP